MRMRFERAFLLVGGVFAFGTGVTERPATRSDLCQSSLNGNYLSTISRTGDVETFADEGLVGLGRPESLKALGAFRTTATIVDPGLAAR